MAKRTFRRKAKGKHTLKVVEKKVNKISRTLKPEIKQNTAYLAFQIQNLSYANARTQFAIIPQGTGKTERIGNKIMGLGIEFRYDLLNTGTTAVPAFVRVSLVYDRKPNQAVPAAGTIWDQNPQTTLFLGHLNVRNTDYLDRFSIMYDKVHRLGTLGNNVLPDFTGGNMPCIDFAKRRMKFKKISRYILPSPNGTIGEITEGAYYIFVWSTVEPLAPPNNAIQFDGIIRFTYTDI